MEVGPEKKSVSGRGGRRCGVREGSSILTHKRIWWRVWRAGLFCTAALCIDYIHRPPVRCEKANNDREFT